MSLCLSRPVGRVVVVLALWALSTLAVSAQPPVTVTAADPATGETETVGLIVKVKGKNFASGAQADFFRSGTSDPAGVAVRSTRFVSSTELEATLDIAAGAALSLFDIRVTNTNGRSGKGSDLFKVVQKAGAKPVASVQATMTFRCYSDPGSVSTDPCAPPLNGADNGVDRVKDDFDPYSGVIDGTAGVFNSAFTPTQGRLLTLLLGDFAPESRTCEAIGNCNPDPDGPLHNTDLVVSNWSLRVKPLVFGTWDDMPGGLTAMSCGLASYGFVHFTFWLEPTPDGHWGLNFNPRAYAPSTAVTLTRVSNLTWTVEATSLHSAELISFVHSGIRRKNGPSREGSFRMPFNATISVASLPNGAVTCN